VLLVTEPVFAAILELLGTTTATFEFVFVRVVLATFVLVADWQPIEATAKAAAVKIVSLLIVNSSSSSS
jgi:hypothetical protein